MPNLKGDVRIMNKANTLVANADKVSYTVNKAKGEPFPRTANLTIYGLDIIEGDALPNVFDIVCIEDNGIIQKRTAILNCSTKGTLGEYTIAVAVASDTVLETVVKSAESIIKEHGLELE